jgi:hypothetical protein
MRNQTERGSSVAENRKQKPNPKSSPKSGLENEAQSKRFMEDAKLLDVDESGDAFERAMGVVVPPKHQAEIDKK